MTLSFTDGERGWRLELTPDQHGGFAKIVVMRLEGGQPITPNCLRRLAKALPALSSFLDREISVDEATGAHPKAVADSSERGMRLLKVAKVYSRAAAIGEPPVVAVCEEFSWSRAHANRFVREARDLGLLPPSGREKDK